MVAGCAIYRSSDAVRLIVVAVILCELNLSLNKTWI